MKIFGAVLLLAAAAGTLMASPVTVDFTVVPVPQNIDGTPHSIDALTFQYDAGGDPLMPPTPCAFDAGLGGTQFDFACTGAQLDQAGLLGTTDGAYTFTFASPATAINFSFGIYSAIFRVPADTDFGLAALFFNGPDLAGLVTVPPAPLTCDGLGGCAGTLSYTGPQFTQAWISFSPVSSPDPVTGLTAYGQSLVSMSDVSYELAPEPGTWSLLIGGALIFVGMKSKRWFARK